MTDHEKRVFLALDFSLEDKDVISKYLDTIPHLKGIKRVQRNQIHITIKFYGNLKIDVIEDLIGRFDSTLKLDDETFNVEKTGAFPDRKRPKVIWIGVDDQREMLKNIFTKVEKINQELSLPLEKRSFRPHLTLARIKPYFKDYHALDELFQRSFAKMRITPKGLVLFESQLTSKGPVYSPLWKRERPNFS